MIKVSILPLLVIPAASLAQPRPLPTSEEALQIAKTRRAGLAGDRSQIGPISAALDASSSSLNVRIAAIRALAQLRSFGALSSVSRAATDRFEDVRDFATVCRARIIAEHTAESIADPMERARAELNRFLRECEITVQDLRSARTRSNTDRRTDRKIPLELMALRELADMVYRRRFAALADTCAAAGVRFETDAPSSLKIRLAPLTSQMRLGSLIDSLSSLTVLTLDDDSTLQLAADEGLAASRAAVARLQLMAADQDRYHHIGFAALFGVIRGVGDKDAAPVIETFLTHPNRFIRYYANQVLPDVKAGIPRQYQPNY